MARVRIAPVAAAVVVSAVVGAVRLAAEDKKEEPGFYATGDFSYLWTSGNSKANSFGLKADLTRLWTKHKFQLSAGGLRAASSTQRIAVGTPLAYEPQVRDPETTAEDYHARAAYDRRFSDHFFYTASAGWERRPFSGINNRWIGQFGMGYAVAMGEPTDLRAALGVTYTAEDPIIPDPSADNDFAGMRLRWELKQAVGSHSKFTHVFLYDQNLGQADDRRFEADFALAVSINKTLALKSGLHFWYDHLPSLEQLALFLPSGVPTDLTVPVRLKKVDTQAIVALVVNFTRKDAPPPTP
jgi:putative salt-induced outer membrane protein YdiY